MYTGIAIGEFNMLRSAIAAAAMIFALPVAAEPVRFAVTDIEGLEALQQEFSAFEKALDQFERGERLGEHFDLL